MMPSEFSFSFEELKAKLSIAFMLDMPNPALRIIFKAEGFKEILGGAKSPEIAPGIAIGPPTLPIAVFQNTRIQYVSDRHILEFEGSTNELKELSTKIPPLFLRTKYPLKDVTRYCEFVMPMQPVDIANVVDMIRSKISMKGIKKFKEVCGYDMKPFRISLSNSKTPLTDDWLHIVLQPDVNSPSERLLIEIIRRTPTYDDILKFLEQLDSIFDTIRGFFSE